jgi:hypothetical protein
MTHPRSREDQPQPAPAPAGEPRWAAAEDVAVGAGAGWPAQILRLQATAGNAAVARAARAGRLGAPARPTLARDLPALVPQIKVEEMPADLAAKVAAYLETMRLAIQLRKQDGTISMPEVVNMVRQNVPDALAATPFQIELVVTDTLKGDTPPASRGTQSADGRSAQLEASILNLLPKPPKELKLYAGPGSLSFSMSGVEAQVKAGPVTATADQDGGSVKVKEGGVAVTGTGSFQGDAFGLKASIGSASFDASVHKDSATKQWSKWQASVKIPIAGGETVEDRPPTEEITESVMKAQAAIAAVIAHLQAGGSPSDDFVKQRMGDIKPAISKVSAAVEQRKGPKASVKLSVGTGDPKLGTYGMVSLVVEF